MVVIFDQENTETPRTLSFASDKAPSGLIALLLKTKLVKTVQQANILMIFFMLSAIAASIVIYLSINLTPSAKPAKIIQFDTTMMVPPGE